MSKQREISPRIAQTDILSGIARRTNFTKVQINEVFSAYREILDEMADTGNRPLNLEVCLPHIGYFKFKRYKAKKMTGRLRAITKVENKNYICEDVDLEDRVIGEYDKLIFKLDKNLDKDIKYKSRNKLQKQKEIEERFE